MRSPAVGPGVGHDPADRARLDPLLGDRGVPVKRAHGVPAGRVHERGNLLAAADLPAVSSGRTVLVRGDDPPGPPARRYAPNAGSASTRLRRALPLRTPAGDPPPAARPATPARLAPASGWPRLAGELSRIASCPRRARCSAAWVRRSAAACSSRVRPGACWSSSLVARATAGSTASSAATRSPTAPSSSAPGTTSSARRSAAASAAPTVRLVRHSSSARGSPTMSTSGLVPVRSGHQAERGLFHAQLGVVGQHPQVTGQRELEPGSDGVTAHRGHRHDARIPQPPVPGLAAGDPLVEPGIGRAVQGDPRRARPRA